MFFLFFFFIKIFSFSCFAFLVKKKAMICERGRHTNCELYLNNVKFVAIA